MGRHKKENLMSSLRYPIDSGDRNTFMPTVTFTPYKFEMAEGNIKSAKHEKKVSGEPVVLYMPSGVSENYGGQWNNDNIIDMTSISAAIGSLAAKGMDALSKSLGMLGSGLMAKNAVSPAPTDILIYQKPVQPALLFNYEFVPRNSSEGKAVVDIIRFFKDQSIPTCKMAYEQVPWGLIDWPSVWSIVFKSIQGPGNPMTANRYENMALESANVTYSGGANSSLVFWDEVPVRVSLQLTFKSIMYAIKSTP
jgi:hypothetical protein